MELLAGLLIVLVIGVSLALGVGLVVLIWRDRRRETGLDWDSAERVARKDGSEDPDDGEW